MHAGETLLSPTVTRRLIGAFLERPHGLRPGAHRLLRSLTAREREVLEHLARGSTNAEIAGRLHLSETTVKTRVARVFTKLGLRDRVQAVIFAYENGLVADRPR